MLYFNHLLKVFIYYWNFLYQSNTFLCLLIQYKMTFSMNSCSTQFAMDDTNIDINRKFLISLVITEILIIVLLRILSALKNHDISLIKKQLNQNKKEESNETLKTQNILKSCITITNCEQNSNRHIDDRHQSIINNMLAKTIKSQQEVDSAISMDDSSESSQNQENNQEEDKLQQQSEKWFINLYKLRMQYKQYVQFCMCIFGHSFIAIASVTIHFPYLFASFIGLLQFIIMLILLFYNMMKSNSQIVNIAEQTTKSLNQNEKQTKKQKCSLSLEFNKALIGFIYLGNIILLLMTIFSFKMSYFNPIINQCAM